LKGKIYNRKLVLLVNNLHFSVLKIVEVGVRTVRTVYLYYRCAIENTSEVLFSLDDGHLGL